MTRSYARGLWRLCVALVALTLIAAAVAFYATDDRPAAATLPWLQGDAS